MIKPATRAGAKFMVDLERTYGKATTTRTWKTVQRIVALLDRGKS